MARQKAVITRKMIEHYKNMPAPKEPMREVCMSLVEGQNNVWCEYVPSTYTGETPVPLVVEVHGGNSDAFDFINYVPWYIMAEERNFIAVYPTSPEFLHWNCDEGDIEYLYRLILHLQEKYNIDPTRIYMQGMSNGDMMTLAFAAAHPEVLAAAGYMTGPSSPERMPKAFHGELPGIQMRGEKDILYRGAEEEEDRFARRERMNDDNRALWMKLNQVNPIPRLAVWGKDNYAMYNGPTSDLMYWEIADMGHRVLPHTPALFYDYFYSGYQRTPEGIRKSAPICAFPEDKGAFALAVGSNKVYFDGKISEMDHTSNPAVRYLQTEINHADRTLAEIGEMFHTVSTIAPIGLLREVAGAQVEVEPYGQKAHVTLADGRKLEFASRAQLYQVDGQWRSFKRHTLYLSGTFYIPLDEVVADILGMHYCLVEDAFYASHHPIQLTRGMARIIHELLDDPEAEFDPFRR